MSEESNKAKRFSIFKKPKKTEETQEIAFDETTFDFTLTGGPYQTTLIQASAKVKVGPSSGMPLPLKCTWYRAPSNVDFQQIEGVTSAFYQPNADDVGCKVNVHAVPVSEVEDYTGMPAFAEVGPLQLDPKIQREVDDMIKATNANFTLKVMGTENLPNKSGLAMLYIDKSTMRVLIGDEEPIEIMAEEGYPQVRMSPYPSTNLDILLTSSQKLLCQEESSELRDTIAVTLRAFAALRMNSTEKNTTSDSLLRIQQLTESLTKTAREREFANTQMNIAKEKEAEMRKEKEEIRTELETIKLKFAHEIHVITENFKLENEEKLAKIALLEDEKGKLMEQIDTISQQCNFFKQDIGLYKSQMSDIQFQSDSLANQLNSLKLLHMSIQAKVTELKGKDGCRGEVWEQLVELVGSERKENATNSSKTNSIKSGKVREEQKDSSEELKGVVRELRERVEELQQEVERGKTEVITAQEQVLQAEAERNFFKKKCESLTRENEHLLSDLGRNPKSMSEFERQKEIFISEKEAILKEMAQAREQAETYRATMEVTQLKLEQEIHRNVEIRKHLQPKKISSGPETFQNIINALTEALTDREAALNNQKDVNRGLMNRVTELEAILLGLSQKMC